jgi:hypothetical protein
LVQARSRWFFLNFRHVKMDFEQRLELIGKSLDRIASLSSPTARRFALSADPRPGGRKTSPNIAQRPSDGTIPGKQAVNGRMRFNKFLQNYCEHTKAFIFVDVEELLDEGDRLDWDHFTRKGYLSLASYISANLCVDASSISAQGAAKWARAG